MRLVITAEIDPDGQSLSEIRRRVKGHASIIRRLLRQGDMSGAAIESFVLPTWESHPRLTRIDMKVEA